MERKNAQAPFSIRLEMVIAQESSESDQSIEMSNSEFEFSAPSSSVSVES